MVSLAEFICMLACQDGEMSKMVEKLVHRANSWRRAFEALDSTRNGKVGDAELEQFASKIGNKTLVPASGSVLEHALRGLDGTYQRANMDDGDDTQSKLEASPIASGFSKSGTLAAASVVVDSSMQPIVFGDFVELLASEDGSPLEVSGCS